MPVARLKEFLDKEGVRYVVMQHSPAFTAQEVAAYAHIPGRELAKTVIVKIDGRIAMAVVPASHRVDFDALRDAAGAKSVDLASESEFQDLFPACDVGAMPPFGNLYEMDVFAAEALTEDVEIAFSAGSHAEVVRLAYADFERLVDPTIARISVRE
ncbi:MAG: YbaK/EbsC family protein [Candidatus Bipolaricaulota bacterium]|nr:MAG: YbaK/EbsC family protein [Candidatus Bipolaricaulota bacterium]